VIKVNFLLCSRPPRWPYTLWPIRLTCATECADGYISKNEYQKSLDFRLDSGST
jgi:hypothetical protein